MQRVFHPVAVHFKGSGFYNTDYGKKKAGASSEPGSSESRLGVQVLGLQVHGLEVRARARLEVLELLRSSD